ncbi:carbon-nitrogen hydrolase family protein [Hathewaya histolytica]|uniref:Predicted amidohydrolase n=1 Tax=Hathewaya histolytica TaxID=1498 RepID=A0A4U9QXS8_HATHI|nr:carbon-nitrogen hydrolase family protein [Hathewaya histolytica]VTQ83664.1 Predicted amidohydrolase [Hathewaya histolytica]
MKIGLVSSKNKDGDINYNIKQIENYLVQYANSDIDLLCFGESFLQGFEGLTWSFEEDYKIALSINDNKIVELKNKAKYYNKCISFGFIEKYKGNLFSSNLVIDKKGEIVDIFKRVSSGWKEPIASSYYKEGSEFHIFKFMNKTFATAICGDLWDDKRLHEIKALNVDMVLWPLYVDFAVKEWNEKFLDEYINRVKDINSPVCMINSLVDEPGRANGGCYVFQKGKVLKSLPMGNLGVLEFEI